MNVMLQFTSIQTVVWLWNTQAACEENIKTRPDAWVTLMTLFGNILINLTIMYGTKYKSQKLTS